ncbi:MAG: sporulation protein YabP [Oscillospiraceae bacterium]|nr:sporulation protein YabP [Oscillospiraceae bacterium]MBQ9907108.1 sporulation protein YabP [Oscillospiraceae bacterium]
METVHSAILENREKLQLSGVTAIDSFDDRTVILYTGCGQLTVIGRNLQMQQLSVESGAVTVEGEVQALRYSDRDRTEPAGFFGRLLR